MFYGYVYALADGEPVTVLCESELDVERSLAARSFTSDADYAAFWRTLSMILPTEVI